MNPRFPKIKFFGLLWLLWLIAYGSPAHAHPNGVSKITLKLEDPDSLWFHIDMNRDDVINAIQEGMNLSGDKPEEFARIMKKAAYYVQGRLRLSVDGRGLATLRPVGWDSAGKSDPELLDSADLFAPTYVLSFATRVPASGEKLSLGVQLFLEFGIQPLSEITVLWHDQLVKKAWLTTDNILTLPLNRDSLAARVAPDSGGTAQSASANVDAGFFRFVYLGFTHILPHGLDHILFVLGLFFFSTFLRPLLWQITAFTIAHSLTLGLSLLGVITFPARIVEPLIALSIAIIAIENIFFRRLKPSRWLIVFAFGLVHGLGFAGVLRQLGVPQGEFWTTLIGFNLGVELGQITIVTAAAALTFRFWKKPWYFKAVVVPISSAIALVGLYWAIQRAFFP